MNTILKPLTQLSEILSGGTPSKKIPEYWDGDIPWISAKTMKISRVSTSNLHISKVGLEKGSKIAPKGSILILTRGSELFNRVPICFVEKDVAFNQDVKCIIPHKNLDGEFLYHFFKKCRLFASNTQAGRHKKETTRTIKRSSWWHCIYLMSFLKK